MLAWALAFFILAVIAAVFGFTGIASVSCEKFASTPPAGWTCPQGWACSPALPLQAPQDFICPAGWNCAPQVLAQCGGSEFAKILFVFFAVLFLVSLVAGLLRVP